MIIEKDRDILTIERAVGHHLSEFFDASQTEKCLLKLDGHCNGIFLTFIGMTSSSEWLHAPSKIQVSRFGYPKDMGRASILSQYICSPSMQGNAKRSLSTSFPKISKETYLDTKPVPTMLAVPYFRWSVNH